MAANKHPIVADLDGTLIYSDMTWDCLRACFKKNFFKTLFLAIRSGGKLEVLKDALLKQVGYDFKPEDLPYITEALDYLKQKKADGHPLYLATASHEIVAKPIADYLGIFDKVYATTKDVNLKSHNKAAALVKDFGADYEYLGNSKDDIAVWESCKIATCVNIPQDLYDNLDHDNKMLFSVLKEG